MLKAYRSQENQGFAGKWQLAMLVFYSSGVEKESFIFAPKMGFCLPIEALKLARPRLAPQYSIGFCLPIEALKHRRLAFEHGGCLFLSAY